MTDNTITMKISIPTDENGYALLQCPKCGEYFKLIPSEYEAPDVIEIHCPYCGLTSGSYWSEEVLTLARTRAENYAQNLIAAELKKWGRKFHGKSISFTTKWKPKQEYEMPIISKIDTLEIQTYDCCHRSAKVSPVAKMTVSYCPFCGVIHFAD